MYRQLPIILRYLIAVYSFSCRSVLVFIIADRTPMAVKFQWVKNTTKQWKMRELQPQVPAMQLFIIVRNGKPEIFQRLKPEL